MANPFYSNKPFQFDRTLYEWGILRARTLHPGAPAAAFSKARYIMEQCARPVVDRDSLAWAVDKTT